MTKILQEMVYFTETTARTEMIKKYLNLSANIDNFEQLFGEN
jgi:hypothetical protein